MCVLFIATVPPHSVCICADSEGQCVHAFPLKCFSRWRKAMRCIVETNVLFLSFLLFHQHRFQHNATQLLFQAEQQSGADLLLGKNGSRLMPPISEGPQNFGSKDNFQHFCKHLYLYFWFGSRHVFYYAANKRTLAECARKIGVNGDEYSLFTALRIGYCYI